MAAETKVKRERALPQDESEDEDAVELAEPCQKKARTAADTVIDLRNEDWTG